MKVKTGAINLDVEIDAARVQGDTLNLDGFAGLQEVQTTIHGRELLKLAAFFCKPSVIWLCLRALFLKDQ